KHHIPVRHAGRGCGFDDSLVAPAATAAATTVTAAAAATRAAAAAAAAAAATAAAAAPAFGLGTRFVDGQRAAVHLGPVEGRDGRLRLGITAHLHEAESLGSARVAVH